MDSNRLSSEPYFNPQQPGTVCIAMDRYGHYRPSSENALRFLQQDDVETGIRHFLDDNVKAATLCTYVPDVTLLVFRFQSMKDVPPPGAGQTADRYIRDTFLPFLASESRLPEKKITLADAVYSTLTRGTPDCSVLKRHFMQESGYIEFLGRQRERKNIYRLLTVMRNGYMNVHEKPFTYFDTLLPVARKLEQVTQVKNAAAFNADDFRIYSSVLSRQAEAILQRDFDVRGHRSIVNELDDENLAFTVGRVKLNSVQRAVLHDGHAVHLPENDSPENRRQAYCMADRFENRLVTSARPFPGVRTYRMTSDGLIRPVDPEPDGKAKKRETKSKSNKPKI